MSEGALLCPACGSPEIVVKDSRPVMAGRGQRRRRGCEDCGYRWRTVEITENEASLALGVGRALRAVVSDLRASADRIESTLDRAIVTKGNGDEG